MTKVVAPVATGLGDLLWPSRGFWDEPRECGEGGPQGQSLLRAWRTSGHTTVLPMYTGAFFPPVKEGMWGTSSGSLLVSSQVSECECSPGSREEAVLDPEPGSLSWEQCSEPLRWPLPGSLPTSLAGQGGAQPRLPRLRQTSSPSWGGTSRDWFLSSWSVVCVSGLGSLFPQR